MDKKDKELHRVVVTALIYKPNLTYLITKRASHKKIMPEKWTVPGGGLETNDYINTPPSTSGAKQWYRALENTLRREIKEEVNLEIGSPEFFTDYTFIRTDGIPVLGLSYFAPYVSGEVRLDEDATEFVWVNLEEAKNYDLIDGVWDEVREIDEILRKKNGGFAPRRGPFGVVV